jgi:hypothetical protein
VQLSLKNNLTLHFSEMNVTYWKPLELDERRTHRTLKRAWIGFRIEYREGDHEKMNYYAEDIQKFEKQLGLALTTFSDITKAVQMPQGQRAED